MQAPRPLTKAEEDGVDGHFIDAEEEGGDEVAADGDGEGGRPGTGHLRHHRLQALDGNPVVQEVERPDSDAQCDQYLTQEQEEVAHLSREEASRVRTSDDMIAWTL